MPTTSTLPQVGPDRRPCFYVEIAGIPVLFGSVSPPAKSFNVGSEVRKYGRRTCIVPNRGLRFVRKLSVKTNTVECSPVEVVLASTGSDEEDPAAIFGRLGFVGADASLELASGQQILQVTNAPFSVTMADDPSLFFQVGDLVHVGREAFYLSAIDAESKTVTIGGRNMIGTRRHDHLYDTSTGVPLIMTRPATFFRNRRAVIFEGRVGADGVGRDWVERWRGFVTNEPEFSTSGKVPTVSLHISPLTALLDLPLGGGESPVHLSDRGHSFEGTGRYFSFLERVPRGSLLRAGTNITTTNEDGGLADDAGHWLGTGYLPITTAGAFRFQRLAQLASPNAHPFSVPVEVDCDGETSGQVYYPTQLTFGRVPPSRVGSSTADADRKSAITIQDPTGSEIRERGAGKPILNGTIVSTRTSHYRDVLFASGGVRLWPECLRDKINATGLDAAEGFGMGGQYPSGGAFESIGAGGGFTALHLDTDAETLLITSSIDGDGDPIENIFSRHIVSETYDEARRLDKSWRDDGSGNLQAFRPIDPALRLTPLAFSIEDQDAENTVTVSVPHRSSGSTNSVLLDVTIARAFYQEGEKYILLDAPVTVPTSGELYLHVVKPSGEVLGVFRAIGRTTVTLPDGSTAYSVQVDGIDYADSSGEMMQSFAEYRNEERLEIRPAAAFPAGHSIGEVILQLLCSSGGNGSRSATYDVLPAGAGLSERTYTTAHGGLGQDVDVGSFLAIESPLPNSQFRPTWSTGQSVRDAVGGLLQASGYVADIITGEDGVCRLTAIKVGFPNGSAVVGDLTEADIADKPNPKSKTEFAQGNVFDFRYDYDLQGQAQKTQRVRDAVSIDITGEERVMSIGLPGVSLSETVDRVSQLRPIFSRLRYEFALPRRIFEIHIRGGLALQARIGGTYTLTHRLLRDVNRLGLSAALCRMRAVSHDGWKAAARVELVFYGQAGAGWAPSCSVVGVDGALQVQVRNREHITPSAGVDLSDIDGFTALQAGEECLVIPRGDMDNVKVVSITSISKASPTTTVVFDREHGLTASGSNVVGYLVPMRSGSGTVPSEHLKYAQIGAVTIT